ncbi:unnamed protein product [Spirodela intermedia]|uniref:Uncharacterized protein n=1 Tax=Spirodela intermedia TaxID=51605 RepID=A0A7I8J4G2_SPIIN|nr:unnamed protein product [Spirodela intermedia]CAA6665136.1 unnamed protein product [Spirodela intermedia]
MDLNMDNLLFCKSADSLRHDHRGDAGLRLDCFGYGAAAPTMSEDLSVEEDRCRLVLGLGPPPSSYLRNGFSLGGGTMKVKEGGAAAQSRSLNSEFADSGMLRLGLLSGSGRHSDLSTAAGESLHNPTHAGGGAVLDECSTSAKRNSGGYMPSLLLAPNSEPPGREAGLIVTENYSDSTVHSSPEISATTDSSLGIAGEAPSAAMTAAQRSQLHHHNHHHPKKCSVKECSKGRGELPGCASPTAAGRGARSPGATRVPRAGRPTARPTAAGGGARSWGAPRARRGRRTTASPTAAGGAAGTRAAPRRRGAGRGSVSSTAAGRGGAGEHRLLQAARRREEVHVRGLHEGGRGQHPALQEPRGGSAASTKAAACARRASTAGPTTAWRTAAGSAARCRDAPRAPAAAPTAACGTAGGSAASLRPARRAPRGAPTSARPTGGKRCNWAQGCDKFARGRSGLCAAHGNMMAAARSAGDGGMIGPGLFRGLVSASMTTGGSSADNDYSSAASALSDCAESAHRRHQQQQLLIPPQVLVPPSMKSSLPSRQTGAGGSGFALPEGRVHGGGSCLCWGRPEERRRGRRRGGGGGGMCRRICRVDSLIFFCVTCNCAIGGLCQQGSGPPVNKANPDFFTTRDVKSRRFDGAIFLN